MSDIEDWPRRQGPFDKYRDAKQLLVEIIKHDESSSAAVAAANDQIEARADDIVKTIDLSWSAVDTFVSHESWEREQDEWRDQQQSYADRSRRTRLVFDEFEKRRRRYGAPKAAHKAVRIWDRRLTLSERRKTGASMPPLSWDEKIARVLIDALELGLGRPLRFARTQTGGPDLRVLVAFFKIAVADGGSPIEARKGARESVHQARPNGFLTSYAAGDLCHHAGTKPLIRR
jgi:hypothetical protein